MPTYHRRLQDGMAQELGQLPLDISSVSHFTDAVIAIPIKDHTTDAALLKHQLTEKFLDLPVSTSHHAQTPDHASLDITADIDIWGLIRKPNWIDGAILFGKWGSGTSTDRSWRVHARTNGVFRWEWGDGSSLNFQDSVAHNLSAGLQWVRITMKSDDGFGSRLIKFYLGGSDAEGPVWVQLGTTFAPGVTTSILSGTAPQRMGNTSDSNGTADGDNYRLKVYNGYDGAGTLVADFNANDFIVGDTAGATATDSVGKVWTLFGAGSFIRSGLYNTTDAWLTKGPKVLATSTYVEGAGTEANHPVPLPTGLASGELAVLLIRPASSSTVTTPTGWTLLDSRASNGTSYVFYRVCDGAEGATVTVTSNVAIRTVATVYRITNYVGVPEGAFEISDTNDPPSVSASWGAANNMFIALNTSRGSDDTFVSPTGYGDALVVQNTTSSATTRVEMASALKWSTAGTDNPVAFTVLAGGDAPHSATIVVLGLPLFKAHTTDALIGPPVIDTSISLWRAGNYSGSGDWLDEIGSFDLSISGPVFTPQSGADLAYFTFVAAESDYMTVDDPTDVLAPGAGDFTVIHVVRSSDYPTDRFPPLDKSDTFGIGTGWRIYGALGGLARTEFADGTAEFVDESSVLTDNEIYEIAVRIDRTADELEVFLNGITIGTPTDVSTMGTVLGPAFDVGRIASNYSSGQVLAIAMWDVALTDSDIARASDELTSLLDLVEVVAKTQTTDALIQKTSTTTQTIDAVIEKVQTKVQTTDALLVKTQAKAQTFDALLVKVFTTGHGVDLLVAQSLTKTHTADAGISAVGTRSHTAQAMLGVEVSITLTTDYGIEGLGSSDRGIGEIGSVERR